jgi:small ligand-binding sensory domain FIST
MGSDTGMDSIASAFDVAHATGGDWRDLTENCLSALGSLPPGANLGFVYVSDALDEDLRSILNRLREATRIHDWVGTVGFGVCVSAVEMFDMPAMAIMVGSVPQDSYRILPTFGPEDRELPLEIRNWARAQNMVLGIVHADSRVPGIERTLSHIQDQTGAFLVGGLTASRGAVQEQIAGEVTEGGVSGVLLGGDLGATVGLTQGCSPIGPVHDVTRGRDNIILSLDNRPAFEVFREDIGELLARDLKRIEGYVHAAIPVKGKDTGDYLVRNLMGVYPEKGWVSVGERLGVGDRVMFVRRDGQSAMADLKRMVADVKRRADEMPRAAFYFTCVARGPNLFGEGSVELKTIADILGADVPLIGFFANGEISGDRLYGYTGVLALIL